jgi:flagellar biosynthesis/type III secretory pathway protein FliH
MARCLLFVTVLALCAAVPAHTQDMHLQEAGSALVLGHSTFAHGYRHGYEEGYHAGNTDINMGRAPRTRLTELRDVKTGYLAQIGPRKVFEAGFHAGLKAGYSDGYLGRNFRAVESLRGLAASLDESLPATDPKHVYFDDGFATGYDAGLQRGGSDNASAAQVDFRVVDCGAFHPARQRDLAAEASYCEGYRRGFALGHADGFVLRPEGSQLEASK